MHFLADENFPGPSIIQLENAGHQVKRFADVALGAPDEEVLAYAEKSSSILLTFDKDFGQLIFREGLSVPGVVFYRYRGPDPAWAGKILIHLIEAEKLNFSRQFVTIEEDKVRIRNLV